MCSLLNAFISFIEEPHVSSIEFYVSKTSRLLYEQVYSVKEANAYCIEFCLKGKLDTSWSYPV